MEEDNKQHRQWGWVVSSCRDQIIKPLHHLEVFSEEEVGPVHQVYLEHSLLVICLVKIRLNQLYLEDKELKEAQAQHRVREGCLEDKITNNHKY